MYAIYKLKLIQYNGFFIYYNWIDCYIWYKLLLLFVLFFAQFTYYFLMYFTRTKWKRQTAVGLELLAEAGNYAAVQRLLQTNPYWSQYVNTASPVIMSNVDAMYLRHGSGAALQAPRPVLPRMFIHGLHQHISHLPPPSLYGVGDH